jgi:hypothetical protein
MFEQKPVQYHYIGNICFLYMQILSMMTQFQTLIEMYFVGIYADGGVHTVNNADAQGIRLKYTETHFFWCCIQKCELA